MAKQDKVRLNNIIKEGEEHLALFTEALNGKSDNSGRERLRSFVSRIERMEEEKKAILDDIKEIYSEAKGVGFDTSVLKIIIRRRKEDAELRKERELLVELYEDAIEGRQLDLFKSQTPISFLKFNIMIVSRYTTIIVIKTFKKAIGTTI